MKQTHKLQKQTYKLTQRLIEHLRNGAKASARSTWIRLRQKALRYCDMTPADTEYANVLFAFHNGKDTQLIYNLIYYRDRWCGWRIALIDFMLYKHLSTGV